MFRILFIISCLLSNLYLSPLHCVENGFNFPEWLMEQAKEHIETLKKQNATLTSEDISRSKKRATEALSTKNYEAAVNEFSRLVGKDPENRDNWLRYGLALQQKLQEDKNWKTEQEAKIAAVQLYRLSKTPEDQATALLLYGNIINPDSPYESPSYIDIYQMAKSITDINQLKKHHPELQDLMSFKFMNTRINNQTAIPSACFSFTHPLAQKNVNYKDYLEISPKVDGELKVSNRELCLSPLQFGGTYDVILKAGLPSETQEKLTTQKLSFKVKDQNSRLSFSNKAYILMRNEVAQIPLTAVNVDAASLKVFKISDRAFNQILGENRRIFLQNLWEYNLDQLKNQEGEVLWEGEIVLSTEKNKTITKQVPLDKIVTKMTPGIYVVNAEEKGALFGEKAHSTQWLIVSDMGLTTFSSNEDGILLNVRSLKTGEPITDVEIQLLAHNNTILAKAKTSNAGTVRFDASVTRGTGGLRPLAALAYGSKGDFSFIDLKQPAFDLSDRGVTGRKITGNMDAFMYSEQGVYRPGDTVHLNTFLRDIKGDAKGGLPLTFKLQRPDTVTVTQKTVVGNELGFYEYPIELEESIQTGSWTVLAYVDPKKDPVGEFHFLIEDFVPSRILVNVKTEDKLLKLRKATNVLVEGNYLFGAKAQGLDGKAVLTLQAKKSPFPSYTEYSFGLINDPFLNTRIELPFLPLDNEGRETLNIELEKLPETTVPLEGVLRVTLSDKGGRPESGVLKLPVVTFPAMIGIKPTFKNLIVSESDNEAAFEVVTLDENGKPVITKDLSYELYFEEPNYTWYQPANSNAWQYQTVIQDKFLNKGTISTDASKPAPLKVALTDWGQYRLEIRDPKTGAATSIRFNKGWPQVTGDVETPDQLIVKLNKDKYAVGETGELQIDSPFDGFAILTIANNKILETHNIPIAKKGTRVKFTVNESWGSGAYCLVSALRPLGNKENKPFLPKRAVGLGWIKIDPAPKTLNVTFTLPKEVRPRQTIDIPITVQTTGNKASSKAMVTIVAIDEGILKLTNFKTPDPQNYFFGQRELGIEMRDLYGALIEALPGAVGELRTGGDGSMLSRNMQALSKRSFKIVSLYKGLITLDKDGKGTVKLDLPDFNGTLRVMGVAMDEKRVGNGEGQFLVRDPIVVEGILPRFLAPKDESQFSISFHNVGAKAGEYTVKLKSDNLDLKGKNEFKIKLDNAGSQDLIVPIIAKDARDSKIILTLTGNDVNITKEFEISVRQPKTYVKEIETKNLKAGEEINFKTALGDRFHLGDNTIGVSGHWNSRLPWDFNSVAGQLVAYSYNCIEQVVSKGFTSITNFKYRYDFDDAAAILSLKQNANGSYSLWSPNSGNDIWLTAYVMDFLQTAERGSVNYLQKDLPNMNKYIIPKFTLEKGLDWLEDKVKSLREDNPQNLPGISYALYVLSKANRVETGSLRYFFDTYYDKLEDSLSRAFIGSALANQNDLERAKKAFAGLFDIKKANTEDSTINSGSETYGPYGTFVRNNAAAAYLLGETIIKVPTLESLNSTLDSLIKSLAQKTDNLERLSTQELAWLLRTSQLLDNFKATVKIEVDGESHISSTYPVYVMLSPEKIIKGIKIKNNSTVPIWQQIEISGLPKDSSKATAQGFEIKREYFDLEGKAVTPTDVKQGTQLVAVLSGKATTTRPHQLLIVDLLPAGFEIENTRLMQATNGENPIYPWLTELSKPLHTEPRDDRFVSAVDLDSETRTFKVAYLVRAVSLGQFVHPGLFVEDMYAPTFYARTEEGRVKVVNK